WNRPSDFRFRENRAAPPEPHSSNVSGTAKVGRPRFSSGEAVYHTKPSYTINHVHNRSRRPLGGPMLEKERHNLILKLVEERSIVSVGDLLDLLGASEATIRRDINALAERG